MINKFTDFLKKNDCLDEFTMLLDADSKMSVEEWVESRLNSGDALQLITGAFIWDLSENAIGVRNPTMGYFFWDKLDGRFEEELKKRDLLWYKEYAENHGYALSKHAPNIVKMIIKNDGHCPCKVAGEDDQLCPCPDHKNEIRESGTCTCNLFTKGDTI